MLQIVFSRALHDDVLAVSFAAHLRYLDLFLA